MSAFVPWPRSPVAPHMSALGQKRTSQVYSITSSIRASSCGGIPQFGARIERLVRQYGDRCTRLTPVHAANKACGQSGQVSNLAQILHSNLRKQDGSKHQS